MRLGKHVRVGDGVNSEHAVSSGGDNTIEGQGRPTNKSDSELARATKRRRYVYKNYVLKVVDQVEFLEHLLCMVICVIIAIL